VLTAGAATRLVLAFGVGTGADMVCRSSEKGNIKFYAAGETKVISF
jgi:hypothetical protein